MLVGLAFLPYRWSLLLLLDFESLKFVTPAWQNRIVWGRQLLHKTWKTDAPLAIFKYKLRKRTFAGLFEAEIVVLVFRHELKNGGYVVSFNPCTLWNSLKTWILASNKIFVDLKFISPSYWELKIILINFFILLATWYT